MADALRAAVIGHPIAHSLSPAIFAEFARATGVELDYRALDIAPEALAAGVAGWRADPDFIGCNVTMPHKTAIVPYLDGCDPAARACGAVNVVRRDGSRLIGDNTDLAGIERSLEEAGFDAAGTQAVIFGSGGAAQAVATVLAGRGAAAVTFAVRSRAHGDALVQRYRAAFAQIRFDVAPFDAAPRAALFVNATPLGMPGRAGAIALPSQLAPQTLVFDLVYRPLVTPLLAEARARGLRAIGGLTMLIEQARATYERWFGARPPLDGAARMRLEARV